MGKEGVMHIPNPLRNRATHPLPDGKHRAVYDLIDEKAANKVVGDLLIRDGVWMLVQEWLNFPDGTETPERWIELPPDFPYQPRSMVEGAIYLCLQVDIRGSGSVKVLLLPAPADEPKS